MSDETTLLPCPFCGGEAELKHYQSGDWQIICYHADGCIMRESDLDNCYWENVQMLARQWNTRAELGSETCRIESSYLNDFTSEHECWYEFEMQCGYRFTWDEIEPPNHCPNCGAKVICEEAHVEPIELGEFKGKLTEETRPR